MSRNTENRIFLADPAATGDFACFLAEKLRPGDIVGLDGVLGAGKTFFVQSAARALGVDGHYTVNSPTFSIMQEYSGRHRVLHIDLYRIRSAQDLDGLGLDECLNGTSITFIEWFSRIGHFKPAEYILLLFDITKDESRSVDIEYEGDRYGQLLARCLEKFS